MQKCFQLSPGVARPKRKIRSGEEEEEDNCMLKALKKKKAAHYDPDESDDLHDTSDEDECKCECARPWENVKIEVNDLHETCFAFAH